ncbi:MAG: response regulator [Candidatus Rokubacteria bacterium]|nr:response regulator [Candidatus Rokubacteria bacterium]
MTTPAQPKARKWILVVDDDPRVRAVISERLAIAGYAVVQAGDGYVAMQLLAQLLPHLILLDLDMPRISGPEFLTAVAGQPNWRRIPVLIVSGHELDQPVPEGVRLAGVLAKPVSFDVLLEKVAEALGGG